MRTESPSAQPVVGCVGVRAPCVCVCVFSYIASGGSSPPSDLLRARYGKKLRRNARNRDMKAREEKGKLLFCVRYKKMTKVFAKELCARAPPLQG